MGNDLSRSMALLTLFKEGMELDAMNLGQKQLGDRKDYIGMSDIASFSTCPRKAVLSRTDPREHDFNRTIVLNRGHWIEDGVAKSFAAKGISAIRQLEIAVNYKGVDIRAHLDFCMVSTTPRPTVRVLEVKSMNSIPDTSVTATKAFSLHHSVLSYWMNPPAHISRNVPLWIKRYSRFHSRLPNPASLIIS